MKEGVVTGAVWATKKAPGLTGQSLLRVQLDTGAMVAADLVGAGRGDRVLIALGAAARMDGPGLPVDAAIVAILDEQEEEYDRQ